MRKIALTAGMFLLTSGVAFAGSGYYDWHYDNGFGQLYSSSRHHHSKNKTPATSVEPSAKSNYPYPGNPRGAYGMGAAGKLTTQGTSNFDYPAPGYGRGIWGR